jgi:SMODS and SLOG-associating 2TM effector domain family 4
MAERNSDWLRRAKWVQILLSALTTGGAIGVIFNQDDSLFAYGTAALAISLLILNSYLKDVDPGQLAQKHREVASDIWNVRESYLSLLTDIRDESFSIADLRERRDDLQEELYKIYKSAPPTDSKAYGNAQKALKENEELTFSDAEIDAFLPDPLKRVQASPQ